ncbi:Phosphopantethiene-protein transferase [Flavobacteriales bacterium ALC-1]|nr:Phosphopantethiene-protein transferase [Flavobacteriales bacterium ALC-1]
MSENKSGIKLFKIELPVYYDLVSELVSYLNEVELQRAEKYHYPKDTNRFIICRTFLKFILAQKLRLDISEIQIKKDENKKPYLSSDKSIHFNVSHTERFAIIAISNNPVGVDVEYINKNFDYSEVLPHVFNKQEVDAVLKSNTKDYTFYKFWTRKEAFVKATGKGISDSLPQIPATDGNHSINPHLLGNFKSLNVLSFDLHTDYIAALAFGGKNIDTDELLIYNLPTSLEKLIAFIN